MSGNVSSTVAARTQASQGLQILSRLLKRLPGGKTHGQRPMDQLSAEKAKTIHWAEPSDLRREGGLPFWTFCYPQNAS
jgi:hypothetical protein